MIVNFRQEIWTPFVNEKWCEEDELMISNYGRVQRKKVGEEEADRIVTLSMNRGTIMHRLIELYKETKGEATALSL